MEKNILKNNKGFTLIELLAVIVIMGILMMVAIPAINGIIFDSRVNAYVQSAQSYVKTAKNYVADGSVKVSSYDITYYIHINNLVDDKVADSPFAPWSDAYVAVTKDYDNSYEFHWVSSDNAGWRIDLIEFDKLDKKLVYQGEKHINNRLPIGARDRIVIYDENGEKTETMPFYEMTREEAEVCYEFKDLSETEIMLSRYNPSCGTEVIIPGRVGGKLVTSIYQYAFNERGITSVFIPDSVTSIGSRAFAYNNLTSVHIPKSVTTISSEAFLSNKINYLVIEEGVKTIGQAAFKKNNITEAVVPNSVTSLGACTYCDNPIPNPSFLYVKNGDVYDYSRVRGYIGDLSEFPDKVFRIPATAAGVALERIESSAFSSMSLSGWEVIIPDTVTYIGSSSFNASGIIKINIPDGVTTIGGTAFYNNRITSFVIPNSVTSIGELAFNTNRVTSDEEAWIYRRTASGIDYSTIIGYAGTDRSDIVIPAEKNGVPLTTIAPSAFRYLSLTGNIKIPDTVTSIGTNAFALNNLTDIDNGPGDNETAPFVYLRKSDGSFDKTVIFQYAGYNKAHVDVPSYVKEISNYAFYYSYLKSVTLPEGLEKIGDYAFYICKLNGTVIIPSTVTYIGTKAFEKKESWDDFNIGLTKIVNKTGQPFDWQNITAGHAPANFVTGVAENWYGDIEIVAE